MNKMMKRRVPITLAVTTLALTLFVGMLIAGDRSSTPVVEIGRCELPQDVTESFSMIGIGVFLLLFVPSGETEPDYSVFLADTVSSARDHFSLCLHLKETELEAG